MTDERFTELWTDYLEGELDEHGLAELRDLLEAEESRVAEAADLFQTHRLLGLIVEEEPTQQDEFVRETMAKLPRSHDEFVGRVMSNVTQTKTARQETAQQERSQQQTAPDGDTFRDRRRMSAGMWGAAAVLLLAALSWVMLPQRQREGGESASTRIDVRLASSAHATFFGELSPPVGTVLAPQREYVLMSGMVEVAFPAGASAILEGPAVFRVTSHESLALDVGRCSVHAPDGAEGFRIDTPATRVVDRGTRFAVTVSETSETEVHVAEGAADVYERSGPVAAEQATEQVAEQPVQTRLVRGQAKAFAAAGRLGAQPVPFDSNVYRHGLPDRVVSYEATQAVGGGAEMLTSVTVQRGGRVMKIDVGDLIATRLTWFKSTEPRAFLCGGQTLPVPATDVVFDHSLVTGVINPDGSEQPLTSDPILTGDAGTPGFAVRFDSPVFNGPGADVVFFDLQSFGNPIDGDAFHVSPLVFRDGLKSHTIRRYDLTMESPEAQVLANFYVHLFAQPADSVAQLQTLQAVQQRQAMRFRGLAVGIDLSDLGFAPNERVEGLFFQDALDDKHMVDPVFIAGLPELN
ncbi:FecR family protein [Stieleria sp. ICT_E10.1]|uniref:FecR family protein n=1 Tax=Stieleria sedimenti TaxID=2976331 RepID=UPI00217FADAB|nr:FecR family protein [Stieleria sedimenti]MCS7466185.1 FecR family protein [Stieleria sedimenti]